MLDESTRSLSVDALSTFYTSLRQAVRGGSSVLVVAHSLQEVMAEADRVTILRDGQVVGAGLATAQLTEAQLARTMVGRDVAGVRRTESVSAREKPPRANGASPQITATPARVNATPPRVTVRGLATRHRGAADFDVATGEILGLTGPAGGGWEDAPYLLAGSAAAAAGSMTVDGVRLDLTRPKIGKFLDAGVVLVPERRELQGIASGMSVADNVALPRMRRNGRAWFSGLGWQEREARQVIDDLGVRPTDPKTPVGKLSGGNQQKVLFGKWLLGGPTVMILHEPTQGVDVAARQDLFRAVISAARTGTSMLVVSTDPIELSAICHRVLIIRDGSVHAELVSPDADAIVDAIYEGSLETRLPT